MVAQPAIVTLSSCGRRDDRFTVTSRSGQASGLSCWRPVFKAGGSLDGCREFQDAWWKRPRMITIVGGIATRRSAK
jgi:hypothetical protein